MKISTAQEAINGNSNDTVITPLRLKQVLNSKNIGGGGSGGITKETDPVFNASPAAGITDENIENWNKKQDKLVSGTNIKRVNGQPILGSGDIFFNTILSVNKPVNGEDIWFQINVNLFKIMPTKTGYYIKKDGSLGYKADDRYFINDYMEVKANTSYSLSEKIYASGYHAWYDSNKNLISTFSQPNNDAITVTSPSNAAYVRFSLFDDPNGYGSDKLTFTFEETNPTSSENCIYVNDGSGNYIEFFNISSVPTKTSQLENDSNFINQIKTINGQSLIGEGDVVIEGGSGGIDNETDPTVPDYVKAITEEDIAKWNSGIGVAEEKEIINTRISSAVDLTLSSAWEAKYIPINDVVSQLGNNLSLTSSGKIKVGAGISKVSVQASLLICSLTNVGTIDMRLRVIRNGTVVGNAQSYGETIKTNNYTTIMANLYLQDVQEGDEIELLFTSNVNGTFRASQVGTFLAVEKINETNIISGDTSDNRITVFEGNLLGGESMEISNHKRFLDIYFVVSLTNHRIFGKYTMDTTLAEPNFGSVVLMASDGSTGLEYYVSESKYESSTKTLTHTRTGYFSVKNQTFTNRNNDVKYYIYRIDTYD